MFRKNILPPSSGLKGVGKAIGSIEWDVCDDVGPSSFSHMPAVSVVLSGHLLCNFSV
jgi:hypothetical protein